jgi:hypothetical protein
MPGKQNILFLSRRNGKQTCGAKVTDRYVLEILRDHDVVKLDIAVNNLRGHASNLLNSFLPAQTKIIRTLHLTMCASPIRSWRVYCRIADSVIPTSLPRKSGLQKHHHIKN